MQKVTTKKKGDNKCMHIRRVFNPQKTTDQFPTKSTEMFLKI